MRRDCARCWIAEQSSTTFGYQIPRQILDRKLYSPRFLNYTQLWELDEEAPGAIPRRTN